MHYHPTILLMTATITPPKNCPDLARVNPDLRMNDYYESLKYYLEIPSQLMDRIIFAENSDTDLTPLKEVLKFNSQNKKVEFISFPNGNDFPPEYGKGYGEMLLIDYALDNSKIINEDDIIWKATGRLILSNLPSLIQKTPQNYDLYCDLHNDYDFLGLVHFFDPRFYSFSLKGYDLYFRPHTNNLKKAHIEHYFYNVIKKDIYNNRIITRFKQVPLIKGFIGSSNQDYWSLNKKIQRKGQQIIRTIAPWFWL